MNYPQNALEQVKNIGLSAADSAAQTVFWARAEHQLTGILPVQHTFHTVDLSAEKGSDGGRISIVKPGVIDALTTRRY